ncbi:conserved Plasmodium protein, unknown function [Plasmodium chabaudi chabaudi]|uniref:Uncharacterized protein n=1 Tax=Plasmodium chabaudi chabaudi TaxID=31271 RepID=A0A1D3RRI0_PLACU|nr:conserved Plasmodium protein, unknown function [Plasmodium chabaudi chabaudi]
MNSRFLLFLLFLKFCFCYIKNINRFTNSSFSILKSEKDEAQYRKKNKLIYLNNTSHSTYGNKNVIKNEGINNIGAVENITDNLSCDGDKNASTKFLNANKEEDYNDLYFYHIFKKINIIKKNKYIYSPAKYESIRSFIKRELNDCLDINTTSYIFKLSEYFPKNILDVSVYVNEIINILSFFTFNNVNNVNQIASCHTDLSIDNTKEDKNKLNADLKDLSEQININNNHLDHNNDTNSYGGIINTHISSNVFMENNHMNNVHNFMNKSVENCPNLASEDQKNLYDDEKIQMIKESYMNKLKGNSEDTTKLCNSHGDVDNTSDSKHEDLLISTQKKKDGTKISKVINKDTNYKSFSYFFFRLVDAISGLFCCIGKRSKREEVYNYLKNFKSIEKIKNYSITDINFNTDFMIYIIRLTKYKHDNFICSLKKLKMYDTETIKKIFLSSVYDNILDLEYIKNLEHEYIIKEGKGEKLPNKIFNDLTEAQNSDSNVKTSQNSDQAGNAISKNISQTNLTQIEKKYKFLLEKKLEEQSTKKQVTKINDGDLKNLIKDIIGKNVFTKNSVASKDKKKKKKMKNDNKLLPVYIHEVEETHIMEMLKQNKYSHINLDSITIKNLIKKINSLLRSYDINMTVQVKKENTAISDEKIINSSEKNKKTPEQSSTNMESEQNNEKIKQEESETKKTKTDLCVDLSDITLSEVKDYIHDNEKNEIENINDDIPIDQNSDISEKDVLKYFDVTENKNSIIFEINDYILENENKSTQKQLGELIKFESVEKLDEQNLNQIEKELTNEEEKRESAGIEQIKNGEADINLSEEVEEEEIEEAEDEAEEGIEEEMEETDEMEEEMEETDEMEEMEDETEEADEANGEVRGKPKKKKINKENKEIENLKAYFRYIESSKLKYNFENVYAKNIEEKIELLLFILKNENKKKIIISTDEKETDLIKMKCKIEKVEYEDIVSTLKNIKYYFAKNINSNNSCFIFMNEIENTLVLRKMFGRLRESKDEDKKITIYHFYNSEHKSLVLKKLFYSITNDEDSYSAYLGKPKNKNSHTSHSEKGGPIPGRTSERNIKAHTFEKYNNKKSEIKKLGKKKLKPAEKNWLSFRRRTLKKIDEMKKKAELIKKKKTEKRDKKVKRVIEKLKSKERKRAGKLAKKQTKKK